MVQTKGVAHFTIPVTDTEKSQAFYTRHLGMRAIQVDHKVGMVFLDSGGDCIILARVKEPPSTAGISMIHHAFKVDHEAYEAACAELRAAGVELFNEEDRQGGAVNGPRVYFHDPDGNVLEIIDLTSYKGDAPAPAE